MDRLHGALVSCSVYARKTSANSHCRAKVDQILPVDVVAISKLPAWQVPDTTISRLIPLVRCGDDASGLSCGHRLETVLMSWSNIAREQHELPLTRRFATSPPLCPMIDCTCHPRPEHCCR